MPHLYENDRLIVRHKLLLQLSRQDRIDQERSMNRRTFLRQSGFSAAAAFAPRFGARTLRDFDVHNFGAVGDGERSDTAAIQRAIDAAAAAGGGRVLLRGGKKYFTGALYLRSNIDFHLADDARLVASTSPGDYPSDAPGILTADGATGLRITGTGHIDGQAMKLMTTYSETDMRWEPKSWRPRMFSLLDCRDLEVSGISFGDSPNWGLHMLGCERVLVDGIRIRNRLDVPNCDGIDPDRCRHVEIRNCDIVCADDGIVIKTSQQQRDFGVAHDLVVKNCKVTTRDSGFKIGTETFGDISKVRFQSCQVVSGGRGPTITHRHAGNISDVEFSDIEVVAEHHAARWWGWGEAVSITVWPRLDGQTTGRLSDVRLRNIRAHAENSVRIDAAPDNPITHVSMEDMDVTIDRWTQFPGGKFDNRPTSNTMPGLEDHRTPVYFLRNVQGVRMDRCKAAWGPNRQPYFSYALEQVNVRGLELVGFQGESAFPAKDPPIAAS
jgi:polygalacturonase